MCAVACELIMRVNSQVDTAEKKEKCSEEDECTFTMRGSYKLLVGGHRPRISLELSCL